MRILRDYSAGAGRFLSCFHPTARLEIEQLKKCLSDWPQIFRQDALSQEEHSSKIWLQKTKHAKSYCVLFYNCWTEISALPATRSNSLVRCTGNTVRLFDSKINNSQCSLCMEFKFSGKMHDNPKKNLVSFGWKNLIFRVSGSKADPSVECFMFKGVQCALSRWHQL